MKNRSPKNCSLNDLLPHDGIEAVMGALLAGSFEGQHVRLVEALKPYEDHLLSQDIDCKSLASEIQAGIEAASRAGRRNPNLGRRVRVNDGSGRKLLGEGVYAGEVDVYFIIMPDGSLRSCADAEKEPTPEMIPPGGEVHKSEGNPKLALDNGRVVYGCQVWWEFIK